MAELGFTLNRPLICFGDNSEANTWAESSASMKRAKHIDLKYHFVQQLATRESTEPMDISTIDNPADRFTKAIMKIEPGQFRCLIAFWH